MKKNLFLFAGKPFFVLRVYTFFKGFLKPYIKNLSKNHKFKQILNPKPFS